MSLLASRTLWEVLGSLLLVGGFYLYAHRQGAASCVAADVAHVAAEQTHNAAVAATQAAAITQEAQTYVTQTALPPLPVPALKCVRIGPAPGSVPKTATAQPGGDAAAVVSVPDTAGFDPGPQLGRIGRSADAQVVELQSYIRDVCLTR